ncbi:MAG: nucleoside permease [Rikenellaceae bacterium]|jgi:NHS family xanthosine MFS transporter|nr:nucleoside permease [Rikenellaceae bacterium]
MGLKFRLSTLSFLEFFIWGAWLISLGSYAGNTLHFDGVQIGSFFATMGVASIFMPALLGVVADKWIPAQKLLGVCHIVGAGLLVWASTQGDYVGLYSLMFLYVIVYMPTIALHNSVMFGILEQNGKDVVKDFSPVRVWGTIGFIVAMWVVDLTGFKYNETQFLFAAAASVVLGLYSFSLPNQPVNRGGEKKTLVDALGLSAFTLFRKKEMAVFFIFAMLLGAALQITNGFGDLFLTSFAADPQYAASFGVKHSVVLLSISQIAETAFILTIPFFLKRFGIKTVMLMSMFAWVIRFGLFGLGNPGDGLWMLVVSMVVYGMAFDFFNISGSLFVNQSVDGRIRSSAQGLFMLMSNGLGAVMGSYGAGAVVKSYTVDGQTDWTIVWMIFAAYALVIGVGFLLLFRYRHDPAKGIERAGD